MKNDIHTIGLSLLLSSTLLASGLSLAQGLKALPDYPVQAITIISPFPPGGGNDKTSRILAAELATVTGQSVIVDNRAGAGGNLGTATAARSKPDGYTLVMSQTSVIGVNPALYPNAGFNPEQDLEPISQLTSAPVVFVVRSDSPYKSMNDVLSDARKHPGAVTFATPGNGTLSHLTTLRMSSQENVALMHVPYKGAGPAITDLMGGQVRMVVTSPSSVEGLVADKKLRVIAATNSNLLGVFKDVPTLESQGIQHLNVEDWYGLFAPKGIPADRLAYLEKAVRQAMSSPDVIRKINQSGSQVVANAKVDFNQTVRQEIQVWGDVVRASGAKVD